MRVIKNIANTGRTVISTIHQPSVDLFFKFDRLLLLQRGGWQVYFGPVGRHGRDLVKYMESIPGTPKCPRKMNPASWMLDVLAGTDSSGESDTTLPPGQDAATDNIHRLPSTKMDVHSHIVHGRPGPNDKSPGPVDYQSILQQSALWQREMEISQTMSTPKANTVAYRFDSVFARGFFYQLYWLLKRGWTSSLRDVSYNYTRIMTLMGLQVLFGVIYYKVDGNDVGGVQSLMSVMFMTTVFIGLLNMNVTLPVLIKDRAVFYRERLSYLYDSIPFSIANFIVQLPWIGVIVFTSVPIICKSETVVV
jgi:hypothetical protein